MLPLLQQPQQGHDRRHGQGDQSGKKCKILSLYAVRFIKPRTLRLNL